ncbi:hypothetical protein ACLMNJ_19790 [Streptomyces seoulensis]
MESTKQTVVKTVATGAPALFVESSFGPLDAFDYGVLGERAPFATTSGVENLSCAHSVIATG